MEEKAKKKADLLMEAGHTFLCLPYANSLFFIAACVVLVLEFTIAGESTFLVFVIKIRSDAIFLSFCHRVDPPKGAVQVVALSDSEKQPACQLENLRSRSS